MTNPIPRAGKLAGIVLTAAVAVAFLGTAAPAQGAGAVAKSFSPAATTAAQAGIVSFTVSTVDHAAQPDAAGNTCRQSAFQVNARNASNQIVAWYKLTTSWCHNAKVVTSHTTTPTGGVTGVGGLFGWDYAGTLSKSSNCYIAAGSKRMCSGVHEIAQGKFTLCPLRIGGCIQEWLPTVEEWENYRGQFLHKPAKSG